MLRWLDYLNEKETNISGFPFNNKFEKALLTRDGLCLWKDRNRPPVSNIPTGQVPFILVDTIDGDTIKVRVEGKIETVRYL